jgi:hypothetical protein
VAACEGERETAALQPLTPEQNERLRAVLGILVDYLLDNTSLSRQNETQTDEERVPATGLRAVQLRLEI